MDLSCADHHVVHAGRHPGQRCRQRQVTPSAGTGPPGRSAVMGGGPEHRAGPGLRVGDRQCLVVDEQGPLQPVDRQRRGPLAAPSRTPVAASHHWTAPSATSCLATDRLRQRAALGGWHDLATHDRVGGSASFADCAGSTCMARGPGRVDLAGAEERARGAQRPRRAPTPRPTVDRCAPRARGASRWSGRQLPGSGTAPAGATTARCRSTWGTAPAGTARPPRSAWPWVTGRTGGAVERHSLGEPRSRTASREHRRGPSTASARRFCMATGRRREPPS